MEKVLKLYSFVDGVNDTPFPSEDEQVIIADFRCDYKRMGAAPTITCSIQHYLCLDNLWSYHVYAQFNGERFFIKQIPSSSFDNTDARYKHDVELVSERVILDNVYFYDVVTQDYEYDKPVSNSSNVVFFGTIHEFAERLNHSLNYSGVDYSVVVDEGITSEGKLMSFQDQFFSNVLQEIYNTYDIPYYFVGKVIHIGYTDNVITHTFKYGCDESLLSIQKQNANYKIVNRVTGIGSADNIPYYYPNLDNKGVTEVLYNGESGKVTITNEIKYNSLKLNDKLTYLSIVEDDTVILNNGRYENLSFSHIDTYTNQWVLEFYYSFNIDKVRDVRFNFSSSYNETEDISCELFNSRGVNLYSISNNDVKSNLENGDYQIKVTWNIYTSTPMDYAYAEELIFEHISIKATLLGASDYLWSLNGQSIELQDVGLSISNTPKVNDVITIKQVSYMKTSQNLMPSIYRESNTQERFYNALNDTYTNPDNGEYYHFNNPYIDGNPKEHIVNFEDIKPSIVGMTNASGQRIDMFIEFAFDENDNDEFDDEGNYLHPYFFGKLRKFDGKHGFNLFDHAIDEGEMTIAMTSGSCGGCEFIIGVDDETQKNPVQVDANGNLLRDSNGNVITSGSFLERQNDTSKYEVWVALKKEESTFGVIMPNAEHNYKPNAGDTFVILHIDLPQAYITAAEERLEQSLVKYMSENNDEKFNFSISFSRIFFAENYNILKELNENSRIQIEYNETQYELYISSYSYAMSKEQPLPEIRVELTDTLTIAQNALQNAISEVKNDLIASVGVSQDFLKQGLRYFLRKDKDDRSKGKIASDKAIEVGKFQEGTLGSGASTFMRNGSSYSEVDFLKVRKKATFTNITIQELKYIGGEIVLSPAAMVVSKVEELEDGYKCYFDTTDYDGRKVYSYFEVGDQAKSQTFNLEENTYYWRLVTDVNEDEGYIVLSKTDCDNGSGIPKEGDNISQLGNRYDPSRQAAIILSAYGSDAPSYKQYSGINSYSIDGKQVTKLSPYGNEITGKITITSGSSGWENIDGLKNEFEGVKTDVEETISSAILASKDYTDEAKSDIQETIDELNNIKANIEDVYEKSIVDGKISNAEAEAIRQANNVAQAERELLEAKVNAYADGIVDKEEEARIAEAKKNLEDAKKYAEEKANEAFNEAESLINGLEYGKNNLLRNSGFTGDYLTAVLNGSTNLNDTSDMFSPSLKYWDVVSASAIESEISESGKEVFIQNGGSISQTLYFKIVKNDKYVFSFRGKGGKVTYSVGGRTCMFTLTEEWAQYVDKFVASKDVDIFQIKVSGDCSLCELQLERGTTKSAWGISPLDNRSELAKYESLTYLAKAMKGETTIDGGIVNTGFINMGHINEEGEFTKTTAGISGFYNEDNSVAYWAGGDFKKAMYAVSTYLDNPNYIPTEEELNLMAKFVVTHGGRAILNDIILRGYIYALGGYFKGEVVAEKGSFKNITTPNGSLHIDDKGNVTLSGKIETVADGNKIIIDTKEKIIVLKDELGRTTTQINFLRDVGESWTYGMVELNRYVGDSNTKQFVSQLIPNSLVFNNYTQGQETRSIFSSNGFQVDKSDEGKHFSSGVWRRQLSLNEFEFVSVSRADEYQAQGKKGVNTSISFSSGDTRHILTFTSGLLTNYETENIGGN